MQKAVLYKKIIPLICVMIAFVIVFISGCSSEPEFDISDIKTFRDIPGITQDEIDQIDALRNSVDSFSFVSINSTQAFIKPDGSMTGFTAKVVDFLSELFEMPFEHSLYDWSVIKSGIDDLTFDFSADFTLTPERQLIYHMTYPVAQRTLGVFTYGDRVEIDSEFSLNGLRLGFIADSVHPAAVREAYPMLEYETVLVLHCDEAIEKLISGEIDAYIMEAVEQIVFVKEPEIRFHHVIPLVYNPVAITTANPDLDVIIKAINKYISAGGVYHLRDLYIEGSLEYSRLLFHNSL